MRAEGNFHGRSNAEKGLRRVSVDPHLVRPVPRFRGKGPPSHRRAAHARGPRLVAQGVARGIQFPSTHRVKPTAFKPCSASAWLTVLLSSLTNFWNVSTPCSS